ncbi:uncharacterized protein LOC115758280 [Drosophila novamexicana]|uniref:uncharacterized protein LOC115758280 n=1 Tax=Drosophila novamexicana TaxID=47314 RepID=UPI0011E5C464|nr:uncharacterized protein LOC115758280 [Drosophila novamexicana]
MYLMLVSMLLFAAFHMQTAQSLAPRGKFTSVSFEHNTEFFTNMSCWLTPEGKLNLDVYIKRNMPLAMRTSITVQYQIENSANYYTLFSYDVDSCKAMKDLLQFGLTNIWFRNLRKYGNLTNICPMKAGYYDLRNFHLENNSIPAYLGSGNYRIRDVNYYGKNNANNVNPKAKKRLPVSSIVLQLQLY